MKNPCCNANIRSKNVNSVKIAILYEPKSQQDALFFSIFHEKMTFLMPIFCQKNFNSLKNTLLSCPYFVRKTSLLSKKRCSHVIFFKYFMKSPMLSCPNLLKRTSILSKLPYLMGQKNQQEAPFFRFFTKKPLFSCPFFV